MQFVMRSSTLELVVFGRSPRMFVKLIGQGTQGTSADAALREALWEIQPEKQEGIHIHDPCWSFVVAPRLLAARLT